MSNIEEVQAFSERKVILEKYREKTAAYHQRQEEQIVQEVKAVVPELPNDYLSINTGFAALKLSKSSQLPLHDAKVRAYFNDSFSIEIPFYNSDAKSATYLYTADPKGSYAASKIKKIEATAPGYISESIIPQRTISELTLFGQNEDFIYNYGFQKFPIHSDLRYILVLLRDRQTQPENWALMLDSLNLEVDTAYRACGDFHRGPVDATLLRKKDGTLFGKEHCPELKKLRNAFVGIAVSPKMCWLVPNFIPRKRDATPINNQLKVYYIQPKADITELFEQLGISYQDLPRESAYMLSLPLDLGVMGMNKVVEALQSSGLFKGVEHQYNHFICLD